MGKNKYGKGFQKKNQVLGNSKKGKGDPIRGGKIAASHILVDKLNLAQEIYEDLKIGKNFQNLAKEFSTCPSKNKGGNLGEFHKGKMVPEFWNACVNLKIGQVSQPIKTKFGYHIIKRTG